jgi:hypothetical protein
VYPAFVKKGFVLGVFGAAQVNAAPANPILPELNVDITMDMGVVLGMGWNFMQDYLQVGVAGRFQQRQSYERSFTFYDIADGALTDIKLNDAKKGTGILADIGVIYNFYDIGVTPRIGVAINNFGANSFGDAKELPYSVTLSAGISPSWNYINTDIIIDIRDVTKNYNEDGDWGKRINIGAEARFLRDIIAVRCGLHQGRHPTFGLGLDFNFVKINYAHYYEEIGAYAGQHKDKRHALELAIGF